MPWGISNDIDSLVGQFTDFGSRLGGTKSLHRLFVIEAQVWTLRNWPKQPPLSRFTLGARRRGGTAPLLDTGSLRRSFVGTNPTTTVSTDTLTLNQVGEKFAVYGSKHISAALHNYGGTVRAKRVKNLALPATPEASKAGSPRRFPRELFFVPAFSGRATGWLAERKGEKLVRHYLLRTEVRIPRRQMLPEPNQLEPRLMKATEWWLQNVATKGL